MFFAAISYGQYREVDSFKNLLRNSKAQFDFLPNIAFTFNHLNLDNSYHYSSMAFKNAEAIDYNLGMACAKNLQSGKFLYKREYDKSLELIEEALDLIADLSDHIILSQIYNTMAVN